MREPKALRLLLQRQGDLLPRKHDPTSLQKLRLPAKPLKQTLKIHPAL